MSEPRRPAVAPVVRYLPPGSEVRWSHCPVGWVGLLDHMTVSLDQHLPGWSLRQVKSDLGTLALYVDPPDDASPADRATVRAVLQMVAQRSSATCEVCGAAATPRSIAGWLSVLCDEHQSTPGAEIPMVELRVVGTCHLCGHPDNRHQPDNRLAFAPRVCSAPSTAYTACGCPLVDTLKLDAEGDFEIITAAGTRYYLRLGGADPRWFRAPSSGSSQDYAGRWNRLGSLRGHSGGPGTPGPLRVGETFTVSIGSFSDLMHASRIMWMRRVADPADLPPEVEYRRWCNRNPVDRRDEACEACIDD